MYSLTSEKSIKFYDENKHLDFNRMNDLFVDIIGYVLDSTSSKLSEVGMKGMLESIIGKLDGLNTSYGYVNTLIEKNKELYISEMRNLFERKEVESVDKIKEGIVLASGNLFKDALNEIPKGNEGLIRELDNQKKVFELESRKICDMIKGSNDFDKISRELDIRYEKMQLRLSDSMQGIMAKTNGTIMEKMVEQGCGISSVQSMFSEYLEKQKNSTLKGKESEIRLEILLNELYPNGKISNNTGEAQSCDYLLERDGKDNILFENKDYRTNVPDVEIKKLIRDIENKKTHGIILSQRSGIQNKKDYHIDLHMGFIIVYVHNVNYDDAKIRIAVQIIDHLVPQLKKLNETQESSVSLELMSEINKEYLCFIGQKKQILESIKKFNREMMKQVEDIEMPSLTSLLNSKFTNVEQLEFKCDICNNYTAKNHRALVTHKNSCRKRLAATNTVITVSDEVVS
tara:strand:+ start:7075 stop:8445 length:1371 start_codon:yes stop_codon:yes gene_type:complete